MSRYNPVLPKTVLPVLALTLAVGVCIVVVTQRSWKAGDHQAATELEERISPSVSNESATFSAGGDANVVPFRDPRVGPGGIPGATILTWRERQNLGFSASFVKPPPGSGFSPQVGMSPMSPITDAPIVRAAESGNAILPNDLVIGIHIDGEFRAYPLNMLKNPSREIINDLLAEQPIAVTWCHLCHNAVVYLRRVDDRTLTFAVSGMLWNRNLVMVDSETETYWSHLLGEAMHGPLKGQQLEMIPSRLMTWSAWLAEHPDTSVLKMSPVTKEYTRDIYWSPERFVIGWVEDGYPYHVRLSDLMNRPLQNIAPRKEALLLTYDSGSTSAVLYSREVDGAVLTFTEADPAQMRDDQTNTLWNRDTGEAVAGPLSGKWLAQKAVMPAYWQFWDVFHPESTDVATARTPDSGG